MVWLEKDCTDAELDAACGHKEVVLSQNTPIRVLHRRTQMVGGVTFWGQLSPRLHWFRASWPTVPFFSRRWRVRIMHAFLYVPRAEWGSNEQSVPKFGLQVGQKTVVPSTVALTLHLMCVW